MPEEARSNEAKIIDIFPKAIYQEIEESLQDWGVFLLTQDMASHLNVADGDVVLAIQDSDMGGAGIHDGAVLIMRPLAGENLPQIGDIALVHIQTSDGKYLVAINRWMGTDVDGLPILMDGYWQRFNLPEATIKATAIAVAHGIIGPLRPLQIQTNPDQFNNPKEANL